MLIFNPVLIMEGSPSQILLAFVTCVGAAYFLAAGLVGYFLNKASWWQRVLFITGGVALLVPAWQMDLVGIPLVLIPALVQFREGRMISEKGEAR